MYSMTGYGKGDYRKDGIELTVEVKSVNNRFLDLTVKSPRIFACFEELIRSHVRESITRGHVDVFVSFTDKRERRKNFFVDIGVAKAYGGENTEKRARRREGRSDPFLLSAPSRRC
jgi:uncharacterized protein (TIGR00255 family)